MRARIRGRSHVARAWEILPSPKTTRQAQPPRRGAPMHRASRGCTTAMCPHAASRRRCVVYHQHYFHHEAGAWELTTRGIDIPHQSAVSDPTVWSHTTQLLQDKVTATVAQKMRHRAVLLRQSYHLSRPVDVTHIKRAAVVGFCTPRSYLKPPTSWTKPAGRPFFRIPRRPAQGPKDRPLNLPLRRIEIRLRYDGGPQARARWPDPFPSPALVEAASDNSRRIRPASPHRPLG